MSNKRVRVAEGIYKRIDTKGVLTYYISYRENAKKLKWEKVGRKEHGVTLAYCKQLRSKRILQISLGEDVSNTRKKEVLFFDSIAQDYLDNVNATLKDKAGPDQRYRDHIKPYLGNKELKNISKLDVESILKIGLDKGLKAATVDRIRQTISAIFNLAIYNEKWKNNPAKMSRNENVSLMRKNKNKMKNNDRERYLKKGEAQVLLQELEVRNHTVYIMTLMALTTGARAGEILGIRFKDIDYENLFITLSETKNGTSRKIKITPKVQYELMTIDQREPNDFLFTTQVDTKYTKIPSVYMKTVNRLFNRGLEGRDAKNRVVFHSLRHTFASWLAIEGVPIYTIKSLMGHKDITQTMRYAKLSPHVAVDAVMSLENTYLM